jgi:hypothetical protein
LGDLQRITAGEYAQIEVVFLANGLHVVRATFRCDLTTALKRAEREPAPHSVDAAKDHETPNGNLLTVFVDGLKFLPLLDELDIEVLKLDRITLQQQVLGKNSLRLQDLDSYVIESPVDCILQHFGPLGAF